MIRNIYFLEFIYLNFYYDFICIKKNKTEFNKIVYFYLRLLPYFCVLNSYDKINFISTLIALSLYVMFCF